jgi:hypothetical protein
MIVDPACGSAQWLGVAGQGKTTALNPWALFMAAHHGGRPNIFLSFNGSIAEGKAALRREIKSIESVSIIDGQRRYEAYNISGCASPFGDPGWWIPPQAAQFLALPFANETAVRLHRLKLAFRLTAIMLVKLAALFATPVLSFKKAVAERKFFVLHETHPPAASLSVVGLLAGAFQAT